MNAVIEKQEWEVFAKPQHDPIVPLVQEFHANVDTSQERSVSIVRGVEVTLNPKIVHDANGTKPP